ncbi:Aerotolerance protein BatB / Aerotolerance protein BatC [hydrothermal vent metagenome]|uniref:Aerotolerance protein BatB / Aerotolerance protein BatC n=1 Tax=hydrothermal vent metagenome TaxID=652676 RepID=A0A3B0WZD9_9ZZZZ
MDSLHWLLQLHLIRPWWLLALIPLALLIWTFSRMQTQNRNWTSVIDSRLLAHLLQSTHTEKKSIPAISLFAFGSLVIFALTGPAFEKRPQPVFKTQSALVIILDLSLSMNATDVKPSRLSRAHFKIVDILNQRKEGQTALIAYAANAYTVSPLTDDAYTISAQISALQTSIMPGQGSRLDIALKKARELFTNAGHSKGNIFIVSDSINKKALNIIEQLNSEGFITSMLAIGTREGAPIALKNGGFVKDRSGNIVIPKLDIRQLQQAAQTGGGRFSLLSADDRDINHLMSAIDIERNTASHNLTEEPSDKQQAKLTTDIWYEQGPWLLLLVIPFAAYTFRKGLVFVLVVFILPLPQPAQAIEWSSLWKNSDQQGEAALQKGEAEKAAGLFNDPEWKATAQYRAGQYQQAAEQLSNIDTPQANYNRGNALAKAGQLDQAIEAYNRAIELQADHEDAIYNKQLLEKAQQEKKDNKEKEKEKNKDDKNEDQKDKNQQNSDSSQQDDSKSENSDNKDSKSGESGSEKSGSENNSSSDNNKEENSNQASQDNKQTSTNSEKEAREKKIREKEAEEKEARERAEKNTEQENTPEDEKQRAQRAREIAEQTPDLNQQQTQQWLNKIPDDPGGLLRRKFQYQYSQDKRQEENQPW